jgi:urease accessory protein UreF
MRLRDLVDTSEDMVTFVERYQRVWETEGRAMIALGEFLTLRAESMRYQVEMMRMGNDAFKRYNEWLEALMSLRPDTIMQSFMRPPERSGGAPSQASDLMADDKGEDAT